MRFQAAPRQVARMVGAAASWPVASQQRARRNALVASTSLTARRAEQREVDDFLARHAGPGSTAGPVTRHTA